MGTTLGDLFPLRRAAHVLTEGLLRLVYPSACWVCGAAMAARVPLVCDGCTQALLADPHVTCPRCSSTVGPFTALDRGCLACRGETFAFDQATRLGPYEGVLREVVLRMKHGAGEELAEVVGALWAGHVAPRLRPLGVAAVVPVPLHWTRRLRRGFNQSEVLARAMARALGVPCRPGWVRRVRRTGEQKGLSATDRRVNVRGAFRARRTADAAGKVVLLVDDVLTTGATLHEVARALRPRRPARLVVAVLAHGR